MSLPPELDFEKDRAATPARMNRAMEYLLALLRGVAALKPELEQQIELIRSIGFQRLTEALQPAFDDVQQIREDLAAIKADWILDNFLDELITPLLRNDANLADLLDAAAARGNLGLKSMAEQEASAVAITGGTIDGVTSAKVNGRVEARTATVAAGASTAALDFAVRQVFRLAVPNNLSITFANQPPADKALVAVLHLTDASLATRTITWPAAMSWSGGSAPILTGTELVVLLFWNGAKWMGSAGMRA